MKRTENVLPARRNRSARNSRRRSKPSEAPRGVFTDLIPELRRAVADAGYVDPTPIQDQCIPHLQDGRDLVGVAQTGTGKTAAFALPMLEFLAGDMEDLLAFTPRALILAPTRELALQIGESLKVYGRHLKLRSTVIVGGVKQDRQVKALDRGVDILVATPGRLLDLMQQEYVYLDEIEIFVLDEVDRMLDMGFIPDVKRILSEVPDDRQTLFFSATLPPRLEYLAESMVQDPVRVSVAPDEPTVERIDQKVLFVSKRDKTPLLLSLLEDGRIGKALVFTQMKHAANRVAKKLVASGIKGAAIHGNKSQSARSKALDGFKKGRYRVLVATDVAARGLDIDDVTHVINYDMPVEAETYVHRIGRTARAGADGDAISLCTSDERAYLKEIELLLGKPVPVEKDQPFHCEAAAHASKPAPMSFARGRGGARRRSRYSRGRSVR